MKNAERWYVGTVIALVIGGFLIGYFFGQVQ